MKNQNDLGHNGSGQGNSDISPALLAVGDVAKMLSVSARQVWRLQSRGLLPAPIRLAGNVRWRLDDILAWIDSRCQPAHISDK